MYPIIQAQQRHAKTEEKKQPSSKNNDSNNFSTNYNNRMQFDPYSNRDAGRTVANRQHYDDDKNKDNEVNDTILTDSSFSNMITKATVSIIPVALSSNTYRSNNNNNVSSRPYVMSPMTLMSGTIVDPDDNSAYMSTSLVSSNNDDDDDDDDDVENNHTEGASIVNDNNDIKPIETCSTKESNDNVNVNNNNNAIVTRTRTASRTRSTRSWCLIGMTLAFVACAAAIATLLALGVVDTDLNNNGNDKSSANAANSANNNDNDDDKVIMSSPRPTAATPSTSPITLGPTESPTASPSGAPTVSPAPSTVPSSHAPSSAPSVAPSDFPSDIPTGLPTQRPSIEPTSGPTQLPSMVPTNLPSTAPTQLPSATPTQSPTVSAAPTQAFYMKMVDAMQNLTDTPLQAMMDLTTPQGRVLNWMAYDDVLSMEYLQLSTGMKVSNTTKTNEVNKERPTITIGSVTVEQTNSPTFAPLDITPEEASVQLQQRYALTVVEMALHGSDDFASNFDHSTRECDWPGVTCDSSERVQELNYARQELDGYLAPELSLLTNLQLLDVAQNNLTGFVDPVWNVPSLETIYLFDNQFLGPIGSEIGQMTALKILYLGHNQLTGTVPSEVFVNLSRLRTYNNGKQIKIGRSAFHYFLCSHRLFGRFLHVLLLLPFFTGYLILGDNKLTGTLPDQFRNRDLFYWDFSNNQFEGTLPAQLTLPNLRHLHMEHNAFTGSK